MLCRLLYWTTGKCFSITETYFIFGSFNIKTVKKHVTSTAITNSFAGSSFLLLPSLPLHINRSQSKSKSLKRNVVSNPEPLGIKALGRALWSSSNFRSLHMAPEMIYRRGPNSFVSFIKSRFYRKHCSGRLKRHITKLLGV